MSFGCREQLQMIRAVVALGAMFLTACASGPSPAQTTAKSAAGKQYYDCVYSAANQIDDGTQEILAVALVVKARCGAEWQAYIRAYAANLTPGYAAQLAIDLEHTRLETAATAVASQRLRRHNQK